MEPHASTLPPGRALDLGCGIGTIALRLAALGWQTHGIDISRAAIGMARQSAANLSLRATFAVGDLSTWTAKEPYDLVYSCFALPEGEDRKKVVQTAMEAVKPGGTLLLIEWHRRMAEVWMNGADSDMFTDPGELISLLPGMEIEVAESVHVDPMFVDQEDPRGKSGRDAHVAFVRARKPLSAVD